MTGLIGTGCGSAAHSPIDTSAGSAATSPANTSAGSAAPSPIDTSAGSAATSPANTSAGSAAPSPIDTSADPAGGQPTTAYGPPPQAAEAIVVAVVDGDTITVDLGSNTETVRLLGIDTPEKAGGPRPPECHGRESSEITADLLSPATPVLLSRDTEARDTYGRLLAYVHLADSGRFVNLELLTTGAAVPLSIAPNTAYTQVFRQASADAERNQRGLWGQCGGADVLLDPAVGSGQ